jgi:hypothetical protein
MASRPTLKTTELWGYFSAQAHPNQSATPAIGGWLRNLIPPSKLQPDADR